ncbi:hypothetical protein CCACVL1_09302 [Corchorus capsularis]|uniref:Uncharacterized protein n=1 Tax=Corchorus capsularis TaxID=210143 RepID=A0A1R3IWU7_COCAP|nr:hypothetical protein CCACVL1_09302 [Corchorus capsularis]
MLFPFGLLSKPTEPNVNPSSLTSQNRKPRALNPKARVLRLIWVLFVAELAIGTKDDCAVNANEEMLYSLSYVTETVNVHVESECMNALLVRLVMS